jgi:glucokinase
VAEPRVIGVDLGGTKIAAGLVAPDGSVDRRQERPTPTRSQDELLAALEDVVEDLLDEAVGAVGFGIPSQLDHGRVVGSVNIPLADVDLGERISRRFGIPVVVDNDANAATIAEWRVGAGRGTSFLVMLTLGTGCGGGLILDGKPFRGSVGSGAELGHVVIEHDGRPCQGRCTGRGHLEAYVTGLAATMAARAAFGPAADSHELIRLAESGNATAVGILTEIGRYLGSALGTFVNVFDPELFVIGGGFGAAAGELVLGPAREVMVREALPRLRPPVPVVQAKLGTEAGLIGAGFVGFEALERASG